MSDLVGLLDALGLPAVTIVGHDFGANVAWHAALLRGDRFVAVFRGQRPLPAPRPAFRRHDRSAALGAGDPVVTAGNVA